MAAAAERKSSLPPGAPREPVRDRSGWVFERRTTATYDRVGNLLTATEPRWTATAGDPNDFVTLYGYDRSHRVRSVTDAAGHTVGRAYDRDGNVVSATDQDGNTTAHVLDERAKVTEVRVPHTIDAGRRDRLVHR